MKKGKPMPRAVVFALIVGGALLIAVVGYLVLVKPQGKKLADVKKQIADTQQKIQDYQAQASTQQSAPKIRIADVYRLAHAMPSNVDMPDVLLELDDVAKSAGIQLAQITPQASQPGAGFSIQPITLQFSGDYYSVTDLLYRLRTLVSVRHGQLEATGRLFAVKNVTLAPSGPGLSANVSLETYIYAPAPPAAPAAPAAPAPPAASTTSTDTTSTATTTTASAERSTP